MQVCLIPFQDPDLHSTNNVKSRFRREADSIFSLNFRCRLPLVDEPCIVGYLLVVGHLDIVNVD